MLDKMKLEQAGFLVEVKNNGLHFVVKSNGTVVDYWPTTKKWIARTEDKQRGVTIDSMIRFFRDSQSPAPELTIIAGTLTVECLNDAPIREVLRKLGDPNTLIVRYNR